MRAHTGDWLILKGRTKSSAVGRAMVLEAHGPDGSAPFLVRWIDSGQEAFVFPGPDAVIVTAAEQSEQDPATGRRIDLVQFALEKGPGRFRPAASSKQHCARAILTDRMSHRHSHSADS